MKWIIVTLAVLGIGAVIAHYLQSDPGYVLLSYGNWTVELSLAFAVILVALALLVLYVAFTSISSLIAIPGKIREWFFQRHETKANEALRQGLIAHTEGKWEHAEKALLAQAKKSPTPVIHYLAAARAAHAQDADDRAQRYLDLAEQHASRDDVSVRLTRAELLIERNKVDEALQLLKSLQPLAPKNDQLLNLLAKAYQQLNLWKELNSIIMDMKKYKVMSSEKLHHIEKKAASGMLRSPHINTVDELVKQWDNLSKEVRRDSSVIITYGEQLVKLNGSNQAETLVREAINHHWEKRLIQLYGELEVSNAHKQLDVAEKWLREHPHDPTLLFTLGRICLRNKLWGKARDYLEMSLRSEKNAEAYHTLALLFEKMNEPEKAADCYRKGLEVSAHQVLEYFPKTNFNSTILLRQ